MFGGIVGEGVALVPITVTVSVVIDDRYRVGRSHHGAKVGSVTWRDGHGPDLADGAEIIGEG